VSEPEPNRPGTPPDAAEQPATPRPPSTTIGAGTALAIGCVVVLIVLMAAAFFFLPRLR
jgi:hypothetical protein